MRQCRLKRYAVTSVVFAFTCRWSATRGRRHGATRHSLVGPAGSAREARQRLNGHVVRVLKVPPRSRLPEVMSCVAAEGRCRSEARKDYTAYVAAPHTSSARHVVLAFTRNGKDTSHVSSHASHAAASCLSFFPPLPSSPSIRLRDEFKTCESFTARHYRSDSTAHIPSDSGALGVGCGEMLLASASLNTPPARMLPANGLQR